MSMSSWKLDYDGLCRTLLLRASYLMHLTSSLDIQTKFMAEWLYLKYIWIRLIHRCILLLLNVQQTYQGFLQMMYVPWRGRWMEYDNYIWNDYRYIRLKCWKKSYNAYVPYSIRYSILSCHILKAFAHNVAH